MLEETGIDAEVISLVGLREAHRGGKGAQARECTNTFMVFLLRLESYYILLNYTFVLVDTSLTKIRQPQII